MKHDITKSSIAVLLIMAMIISVLSTLSVINAFEDSQMQTRITKAPVAHGGPEEGAIKLNIVGPEEKQTSTGTISFNVIKGDN